MYSYATRNQVLVKVPALTAPIPILYSSTRHALSISLCAPDRRGEAAPHHAPASRVAVSGPLDSVTG